MVDVVVEVVLLVKMEYLNGGSKDVGSVYNNEAEGV
jgi:hypothetical protein